MGLLSQCDMKLSIINQEGQLLKKFDTFSNILFCRVYIFQDMGIISCVEGFNTLRF